MRRGQANRAAFPAPARPAGAGPRPAGAGRRSAVCGRRGQRVPGGAGGGLREPGGAAGGRRSADARPRARRLAGGDRDVAAVVALADVDPGRYALAELGDVADDADDAAAFAQAVEDVHHLLKGVLV
jgi:hypothetical protein